MSISIRLMTLLILLFSSLEALAQEKSYQYQLDGTYPANLPGLSSAQSIRFTLNWNEKKNLIEGVYKDNFFTSKSPVSGTSGVQGRVFSLKLPRIMQNVSQISLTANAGSVMVFLKDVTDMTVEQASIQAAVVTNEGYKPETEIVCENCGLYRGSLSKISDSNNLCSLPDYGFRLEITPENKVSLYFYYSDSTIGIPTHSLGSYPFQATQHCGILVGTSFPAENCQQLSLSGAFSGPSEKRSFQGRYVMTDETSKESCSYEMVLERE